MASRFVRVVSLWIHRGQEAAFDAFEREAARIMAKYKGRIDNAVRVSAPKGAGQGEDPPYELHILSFPDQVAYESYLADPATQALRERRGMIISRTELLAGEEAGPY